MSEIDHRQEALNDLDAAWNQRPDIEGIWFTWLCESAKVHALLAVAEQLSAVAARMPQ